MEEFIWLIVILGILALVLWIYAIYDIVKGSLQGSTSKVLWLILVIFFPILGAVLYLIFGRSSGTGGHSGPSDTDRPLR